MENYYKLLEVDKDASQEVIDKAYKTLVKKYHPDLQTGNAKKIAEEKIKKINEAYDTLSDNSKRENYNKQISINNVSSEQYNILLKENATLKKELNNVQSKLSTLKDTVSNYSNSSNNTTNKKSQSTNNEYSNTNNKTKSQPNYNSADFYTNLNNYVKNYYKPKHHILKNLFKAIISILITVGIVYLLSKIPAVSKVFSSLRTMDRSSLLLIGLFIIIFFSKSR